MHELMSRWRKIGRSETRRSEEEAHECVYMGESEIVKIFVSRVSVHQRASTMKEALNSHIENGSDS